MYVNGKLMEGGMAERQHARKVYETIRYERKDPALLEWVDGSTFKMRVFPLEGRREKRIILSYTQRLENHYGKNSVPIPCGPQHGHRAILVDDSSRERWSQPKLEFAVTRIDFEKTCARSDSTTRRKRHITNQGYRVRAYRTSKHKRGCSF